MRFSDFDTDLGVQLEFEDFDPLGHTIVSGQGFGFGFFTFDIEEDLTLLAIFGPSDTLV